jgi:hypothetical protein
MGREEQGREVLAVPSSTGVPHWLFPLLASDSGLYAKLIIGRTADGKVAGILLGSVET